MSFLNNITNKLSKTTLNILRGEFVSIKLFLVALCFVVAFFMLVYLSVSMDSKTYRIKELKAELIDLQTQYYETQSRITKKIISQDVVKHYTEQGFVKADQAPKTIVVEKK